MKLDEQDLSHLSPDAQRQIAEKMGGRKQSKNSKYHNQPDTRGGIRFDSKKEARRYDELMLLLKAGKIRNLKLQPQFTLHEAYKKPSGETVWAIRYQADFSYERPTEPDVNGQVYWVPVVEDVKSRGTKTAVYTMKKKLMLDKLGIIIQEV